MYWFLLGIKPCVSQSPTSDRVCSNAFSFVGIWRFQVKKSLLTHSCMGDLDHSRWAFLSPFMLLFQGFLMVLQVFLGEWCNTFWMWIFIEVSWKRETTPDLSPTKGWVSTNWHFIKWTGFPSKTRLVLIYNKYGRWFFCSNGNIAQIGLHL